MKPLHYKKHTLAKRGLSLLCVLALCLGLLPVTALAAEGAPTALYVGNQVLKNSTSYWTTDSATGELTEYTEGGDAWNVQYNPETVTLTLKNATVVGKAFGDNNGGIGIYATSSSGSLSLNIVLDGNSKVSGMYGIDVSSSGGDASLNISGSGSLTVSGLSGNGIGIFMSSQNSANLTIEEASVTALGSQDGSSGVRLITSQTGSPSLTIEVKGGSLQASGATNGIHFLSNANGATAVANLKVSGNAMVKASNIITTKDGTGSAPELKPAASESDGTGGIIWDGKSGTVYGNVTLQEDLEIGEGESLTLDDGASLSAGDHNVIVDGGTLDESLANSLGDRVKYAPAITTPPADKSVTEGETATFTVNATGSEPLSYQWQQSTDKGSSWTNINSATSATYAITNTTKDMSGTQYRCVVTGSGVSVISSAATLTVNALTTYTINATANPAEGGTVTVNGGETSATVTEGSEATLTATVNEGWRFAGWMENGQQVSADATYTFPASSNRTLTAKFEKVYNVTVNSTAGGTATADKTTAGVGETVSLTATPNNGYRFTGWTFSDNIIGADAFSKTTSFTMPAGDVTATANFAKISSVTPSTPPTVSEETTDAIKEAQPGETVTVDLSSGSTKLDKDVFETLAGKDVTLVVDLGDGLSWTVNGSDVPEDADFTDIDMGVTMNSDGIPVDVVNAITGEHGSVQLELAHDGAFGFTMTLAAPLGVENAGYWANLYHFDEEANAMTFETAAPIGSDGSVSLALSHASQYAIVIDDHNHGVVTLPFTDVSEGDWFYDPVCYVYSQGLMTGTSATTFEPNTHLTRAMLVAMLHRLEGSPAASGGDFTDVADGDWYAEAVNWAASVGVVNGFDDGTFRPNTAITREQMAAILRNFAAYKGLDVSASGDLSTFTDAASVSDWAQESVEWMVGSGLLGGYEDSTLQPQGTTTRAEVASVLQRALGNVAGNQ